MKKTISRIISVLLSAALLVSLTACKKDDGGIGVKDGEYLAGGTIPASAKVFPIVHDDISMTISDEKNYMNADDVWTLTHYVDVWATCDDTRGDGFLVDEAKEFVSTDRINTLVKETEESGRDYSVNGVQVLSMEVDNDNRVQVVYVVQFDGACPTENVEEGSYEAIEGLYFKKLNGKWYEDGIGFALMAKAGEIQYEQDDITGVLTITPPADYIS